MSDVEKQIDGSASSNGSHPVPPPPPTPKFGTPVPIGLIAFSVSFLLIGLYTVGAHHIKTPNVVIPFGGLVDFFAGWWEIFIGSTLTGSIFLAIAGVIWGYAFLYIPSFGVIQAFTDADGTFRSAEFGAAVAIFFFVWSILVFVFAIAALRTNAALVSTLLATGLALLTLGLANILPGTAGANSAKAGGAFAIIAGILGLWIPVALLWTRETTFQFFEISPIPLHRA